MKHTCFTAFVFLLVADATLPEFGSPVTSA